MLVGFSFAIKINYFFSNFFIYWRYFQLFFSNFSKYVEFFRSYFSGVAVDVGPHYSESILMMTILMILLITLFSDQMEESNIRVSRGSVYMASPRLYLYFYRKSEISIYLYILIDLYIYIHIF